MPQQDGGDLAVVEAASSNVPVGILIDCNSAVVVELLAEALSETVEVVPLAQNVATQVRR